MVLLYIYIYYLKDGSSAAADEICVAFNVTVAIVVPAGVVEERVLVGHDLARVKTNSIA